LPVVGEYIRPNEEKTRICRVPEGEFDFLGYTRARARVLAGPEAAEIVLRLPRMSGFEAIIEEVRFGEDSPLWSNRCEVRTARSYNPSSPRRPSAPPGILRWSKRDQDRVVEIE
jgi:hypothetical protein